MTSTGALIMAVFAAVWWVVGMIASGHGSPWLVALGVAVTAAVATAALRRRRGRAEVSPVEASRRGRLVGVASAVEGLLILVAINVVNNLGRPDLAAPVVAIVVGLHFLPLARRLPARLYYLTAALLVAVGAVGFALPAGAFRLLVVCVGAACALWLTSLAVLRWGDG